MSVAPREVAVHAIKKWECPQCGAECKEQGVRWPALGPDYGSMMVLTCIGMTCDLVFDREFGRLLGHQLDGEFFPADD